MLGAVLLAHVPFLNLVDDMNATIYLMGGGAAALLLFVLTPCAGTTRPGWRPGCSRRWR